MKQIGKIFGKLIDYLEEGLILAGLLFMTVMNFANVISRYFLHKSISYTEEVVVIVFVWVTMLGISAGYKRNAHLGMSFITDKLSENGKKAALMISAICSLILIYFMLRYGIEMVQNQIRFHSKTTALRWPTYIQGLALPAGAVFMGIRTIQAAYQQLKEGRQK